MMKKLLTLLFLIAFVYLGKAQTSGTQTTIIQSEITCDHCHQCGSCEKNIYLKVKANTKGVKSIKVDPQTSQITVKYNASKTSLEQIEDAITLAGFKANDKPAVPAAFEKLDACCKGGE